MFLHSSFFIFAGNLLYKIGMKNKKNVLTLVLVCLACCVLYAQSKQDPDCAVRLFDHFDKDSRQLTFRSENRDFCDYYVMISFLYAEGFSGMLGGTSSVVGPGEQQLMSYNVAENAQRYGYNYQYALFRGNPYAKLNAEFTYALPVSGEETVLTRLVENKEGYQLEFELPSDTVYACRSGVICDDRLKDFSFKGRECFANTKNMSQLTLSHRDGSFGEYVFRGEPLVYAGEEVAMGEPIAVVREGQERFLLRFSVYFLDKNKLKELRVAHKHTHLRPFFQTYNSGKTRLEQDKTYIGEFTDEMFLQDLTRKEKKRYLQNLKKK